MTITNNLTFAASTKKQQQQQQSLFVCCFFFYQPTSCSGCSFFFRGQDWKTRRSLGRGWEQNNHVKNYFQARLLPYYLRHIPGTRRSWEKGIAAGFYVVTDAPTPVLQNRFYGSGKEGVRSMSHDITRLQLNCSWVPLAISPYFFSRLPLEGQPSHSIRSMILVVQPRLLYFEWFGNRVVIITSLWDCCLSQRKK